MKIYYKMHWSHLFEIDETFPVKIPCKQKQFMISGPVECTPLVAWKRSLPRPKFFFENLSPSSTLSYTITKKPKRVNLRRKSQWGSWSSWGFLLTALSLGFIVIRVLFRFLIERILFRVLSDRVFFESSEIGSSSLGHAVKDSSLHQCSFSAMSLSFFVKSCYYFFLSKTDVSFCIHDNSQK